MAKGDDRIQLGRGGFISVESFDGLFDQAAVSRSLHDFEGLVDRVGITGFDESFDQRLVSRGPRGEKGGTDPVRTEAHSNPLDQGNRLPRRSNPTLTSPTTNLYSGEPRLAFDHQGHHPEFDRDRTRSLRGLDRVRPSTSHRVKFGLHRMTTDSGHRFVLVVHQNRKPGFHRFHPPEGDA